MLLGVKDPIGEVLRGKVSIVLWRVGERTNGCSL